MGNCNQVFRYLFNLNLCNLLLINKVLKLKFLFLLMLHGKKKHAAQSYLKLKLCILEARGML